MTDTTPNSEPSSPEPTEPEPEQEDDGQEGEHEPRHLRRPDDPEPQPEPEGGATHDPVAFPDDDDTPDGA